MNFRILGPLEVTDGDLFLTKGDRPGAEQTRSMLRARSRGDDAGVWLGPDLVERVQLILVELELDRFEVLLEVRDRTGPRDRQDHR